MLKRIFFCFLLASQSYAAPPSSWKSRLGLEWINGILVREVAESDFNPDNRTFNTPRGFARTDIRGDLKYSYLSSFTFYFRPRFLGTSSDIFYPVTQEQINKSEGKWDINEAYSEWDATNFLSLSLGLQNFQWGPAESLSPSNAIFKFEADQKSVFYRAKGKVLARANLTLWGNHSLIIIHEPETNREPNWIANRDFEKKSLVKWESRSPTDSNTYVGLTSGTMELNKSFVGAYFNYFFREKFSFYSDLKKSSGSIAYYPKEVLPGQFSFDIDPIKSAKEQYLAVVGFRVESRGDFRIEWIYNSAGYDKTDISNLKKSLSLTQINFYSNLARAVKPGLEMYTQNYLYLSYRLPDLGRKKNSTFFLRYLHSFLDESGSLEMNWEAPLNNFWNYYIESSVANGDKNTELKLTEKASFFMGVKFSL